LLYGASVRCQQKKKASARIFSFLPHDKLALPSEAR